MEEHKRQELEEASRVQFRAPFLEPESEAVHADEAAEAGSGECQGQVVAWYVKDAHGRCHVKGMLDSRRCQEEAAVNRPKIAGASGRFFALFRVPVLGAGFWGR